MDLISIIIPSFNGETRLPVVLDSLLKQNNPHFEVIVVLDGSTDNSLGICESYLSRLPLLRIIQQDNGGRAKSRNAGAALASSERLLFLDDDIILPPSCIQDHFRLASLNPEKVFFGNAFIRNTPLSDPFSKYRIRMEKRWETSRTSEEITFSNFRCSSANLSISKELFHKVGGFDEQLSDSEDFDLGIRLLQSDIVIEVHKSLEVGHFDQKTITQYISRQRNYIHSKNKLLILHPEYRHLVPRHFDFYTISPIKRFTSLFIYYPSIIKLWWRIAEKGFLMPPLDFITRFHIWHQSQFIQKY